MRLYEFADAEAQLALLRIIIDNTWTAIAQQAAEQQRVNAERKAQAKLKPGGKRSSKGTGIRIPTPASPPPSKPEAPSAKQPVSPNNKPDPNALDTAKPLSTANTQLKQMPTTTAIKPTQAATPYSTPIPATPLKPYNGLKTGYLNKKISALEKEDDGGDRYSQNGITTLEK